MPCNHEGEDFLWMMSISKPNYTWTREDNFPITGIFVKKKKIGFSYYFSFQNYIQNYIIFKVL